MPTGTPLGGTRKSRAVEQLRAQLEVATPPLSREQIAAVMGLTDSAPAWSVENARDRMIAANRAGARGRR